MIRRVLMAGFILASLWMVLLCNSVYSQEITISITVVKASNDKDYFDPALENISSQLKSLNYRSYSMLTNVSKSAYLKNDLQFTLPGNDELKIVVVGMENDLIELLVSIEKVGFKTNLKIVNGGTVIMGGNPYEDGSMVIALTASY